VFGHFRVERFDNVQAILDDLVVSVCSLIDDLDCPNRVQLVLDSERRECQNDHEFVL